MLILSQIGKSYFGREDMDIPRMFGKTIVMIIPGFVGAGAVWDLSHSWTAIGIWTVVAVIFTCTVVVKKDLKELKSLLLD
jgi:hypothetical protein